jgi:hypothetical protein
LPYLPTLVLDASVTERTVDGFERRHERPDLLGSEHVERLRMWKLHERGGDLLGTRREHAARARIDPVADTESVSALGGDKRLRMPVRVQRIPTLPAGQDTPQDFPSAFHC